MWGGTLRPSPVHPISPTLRFGPPFDRSVAEVHVRAKGRGIPPRLRTEAKPKRTPAKDAFRERSPLGPVFGSHLAGARLERLTCPVLHNRSHFFATPAKGVFGCLWDVEAIASWLEARPSLPKIFPTCFPIGLLVTSASLPALPGVSLQLLPTRSRPRPPASRAPRRTARVRPRWGSVTEALRDAFTRGHGQNHRCPGERREALGKRRRTANPRPRATPSDEPRWFPTNWRNWLAYLGLILWSFVGESFNP